jgi:hypothetical protein
LEHATQQFGKKTECSSVVLLLLLLLQVLLILQYSYLTAARCMCISHDNSSSSNILGCFTGSSDSSSSSSGCVWAFRGDPAATRRIFELIGLHNTPGQVLPLFLIYLATLMYNYTLASQPEVTPQLRSSRWQQRQQQQQRSAATAAGPNPTAAGGGGGGAAVLLLVALQGWAQQLVLWMLLQLHCLAYHIR